MILVMVALMMFVLIGLSAFAVDHGEAWHARSEPQSAAGTMSRRGPHADIAGEAVAIAWMGSQWYTSSAC